jgi:hypothetical protein
MAAVAPAASDGDFLEEGVAANLQSALPASVADVAGEVPKAAADAVPALKRPQARPWGKYPCRCRRRGRAGLDQAAKPVAGRLSGVVRAASEAEGLMRRRVLGLLGNGWLWLAAERSTCARGPMPGWLGNCTRSTACNES